MTMIACTLNKGGPVLLGDMLMSQRTKPDEFILPTLYDDIFKYLTEPGEWYPVCLNRKIYILAPNVCIGFAGNAYYISKFLEDVRVFCRAHAVMTSGLMGQFLKKRQDDTWEHFSCIILVMEKDGEGMSLCKALHGQWLRVNSPVFDDVWSTGSGSHDFLIEINEDVKVMTQFVPEDPRHAVQTNTVLIAKLLARERALLHDVKKHWGAGFEMIYWDKDHFTRLDNISYVINQGMVEDDGTVPTPVPGVVLHYKYHGEILVITCVRTFGGRTTETDSKYIIESYNLAVRPFVVVPLDYSGDDDFASITKDLSFDNTHNAMGYIIETRTGLYLPASVHIGPELQVDFNGKNNLKITMEKEVTDRMINEARTVLLDM